MVVVVVVVVVCPSASSSAPDPVLETDTTGVSFRLHRLANAALIAVFQVEGCDVRDVSDTEGLMVHPIQAGLLTTGVRSPTLVDPGVPGLAGKTATSATANGSNGGPLPRLRGNVSEGHQSTRLLQEAYRSRAWTAQNLVGCRQQHVYGGGLVPRLRGKVSEGLPKSESLARDVL